MRRAGLSFARSRAMLRSRTFSRWTDSLAALSLVAVCWAASPAAAQPPQDRELLDRTRRANAVAAQRLEAEVRAAMTQAQRLAASQPAKAVERLKSALAQVEVDAALPEERRQRWRRVLQRRIHDIESGADAQAPDEKQLQGEIRRFEDKRNQEARSADDEKVRQALT